MNSQWLILIYKVPSELSAKRVALWRKLKALGAVYLQNGVCLLPKSDEHQRALKILENDIAKMKGEAVLLETTALEPVQEEKVVTRFNADRDEAYAEFLERCDGFEQEIERESAGGKFTYAELEENDEDLKKLRIWFEKIQKLDFYGASLAGKAEKRLKACGKLLDSFAKEVFDAQAENKPAPPDDEAA